MYQNIDLVYALVDLLQGDSSVYSSFIKDYDLDKVQSAFDYILNNEKLSESQKADLLLNQWRLTYKAKPPTPEEFLSEKYLGRMNESIYPRLKNSFIEFLDPKAPYRDAIFYPHIGWGKSTLAVLVNLYITCHLSLMRDPKRELNLAPSSVLANVLCSFSLKKSAELLLEPFMNILDSSDYFVKVRTREDMLDLEAEYAKNDTADKLFWTTASIQGTSAMTFTNGVNFKLISNKNNLLGLSIVCGTMTELGFFREAGKSDAYIMEFFNDLKKRIYSRMDKSRTGRFFGRSILDSSPNDIDSPIDKYILFDASKNPRNYIISGSRWYWCPEEFRDVNDTFPVFKGGNGKPPAILNSSTGYNPDDVIQVPKELYTFFQDDLQKSLKDLAGIPSGSLDKLFYDYDKIDACFDTKLKNIYGCLRADATMPPHNLIWNQVKDDLFVKTLTGTYSFYYKPNLPRVIHVDQSISNDMTGVALVHVERKKDTYSGDLNKDLIYVVDFVVPIHPFGGRINLEAIKEFIIDLANLGRIPIAGISFDTFQSEASIQALERYGFEADNISVDKTLDPYMYLAQQIEQGNLRIGKNIYFRNNLKSLRIVPRESGTFKVDHTLGEVPSPSKGVDERWETSLLGLHAKDVSDAVAGAVYNAKKLLALNPLALREVWDESKIFTSAEDVRDSLSDIYSMLGVRPTA